MTEGPMVPGRTGRETLRSEARSTSSNVFSVIRWTLCVWPLRPAVASCQSFGKRPSAPAGEKRKGYTVRAPNQGAIAPPSLLAGRIRSRNVRTRGRRNPDDPALSNSCIAVLETPPLALYVHFPWCVRKCPYCDFNSYTLHGELEERRYIEALQRDLEAQAPEAAGREVTSIFMGGGTPSLFSPEAIARLLESARGRLALAADLEVTLEANPGTIERGRFAEYRAAGIDRVSLGAQSFDDARLAALGRIHSSEETRRAATELHAAGLDNFNIDLMYGLPG